jgi:hypothetical protein
VPRAPKWPLLRDALLGAPARVTAGALLPHVRDARSTAAARVCELLAALARWHGAAADRGALFAAAVVRGGEPAIVRPACGLASSLLAALALPPETPLLRDFLASCAACADAEEQGELSGLVRPRVPHAAAQVAAFLAPLVDAATDAGRPTPGATHAARSPGWRTPARLGA